MNTQGMPLSCWWAVGEILLWTGVTLIAPKTSVWWMAAPTCIGILMAVGR